MNNKLSRLIFSAFAAIFVYFVYWQGFYRGADTALCATSLHMDNQQGVKTPFEPCERVNNNWFFWKNP